MSNTMEQDFEQTCKKSKAWKNWLSTEICNTYQVTTCYRESSCEDTSWYYETFIWKINKDAEQGRELIADAIGRLSHFEICESIIKNNGWDEDKLFNKGE